MTLEVIGAGFGRTGTLSIKIALERLGFGPCHHMYEVRAKPGGLKLWQDAMQGARIDWPWALSGFRSQVDWPGAAYWRQLAEAFPSARVILSVRDPDAWHASIRHTILPSLRFNMRRTDDAVARAMSEMIHQTVDIGIFGGRLDDRDHAVAVFHRHVEAVRAALPAERLLVFDVKEGWAPLCSFLGVAVPDEPFPRANSTEEFLQRKPELAEALRRGEVSG